MRTAQTYYTDLNKTRWNGKARDQYYGPDRVRQEYYNSKLVYNNALYEIELPDKIEVEAPGGNDALNEIYDAIECRKTDVDGSVQTGLDYTIYPIDFNIPPNESEDPVIGEFTVVQNLTGLELVGIYEQAGAVLTGVSFSDLEITSVYYDYGSHDDYIPASGGTAELVVEYQAKRTLHYSSQLTGDGGYVNGIATTQSIITGGKSDYSHVTFSSSGNVKATSLLDSDEPYTFEIARVKKLSISVTLTDPEFPANPQTLSDTWTSSSTSNDAVCYQQYNTIEKTTVIKEVLTANDVDDVDPAETTVTTTVTSYRVETYTYTSNYTTPETEVAVGGHIAAKSSTVSVSPSTWSTKTRTLSITVDANTSTSSKRHYVTISNGSDEITIYITQNEDYITGYSTKNIRSNNQLASDTISAVGGSANAVTIYIGVAYDIYAIWASGNQTYYDDDATSVAATSLSGQTVSGTGGAKTGGKVYANNRGTEEDYNERHVYTVTYAAGTYSNTSVTFSGSYKVMQESNVPESTEWGGYVFNVDCSDTPLSATGGSRTATIDSYRIKYTVFTSTARLTSYVDVTTSITKSSTSVTLSTTSVSGENDTCKITLPHNKYSTSEDNYWVKFTQSSTGSTQTVYLTVEADSLKTTWGSYVRDGNAYAEEIDPSGGTVQVYFGVSRSYTETWESDGTYYDSGSTYYKVTATSVSSSISTNIGTASGGKVSVDSRGTEEDTESRIVYTINSATGKISGTTVTFSYTSAYVYQAGNPWEDSAPVYTLTRTPTSSTFDAKGGTITITVNSYSSVTRVFASGSEKNTDSSVSASITSSNTSVCTVSPAQVSGKNKTFVITVKPNTSTTSTKSATVTIKQSSSNKSVTVTISQEKDYLTESCTNPIAVSVDAEEIPAAGGRNNAVQVYLTYSVTCYKYSYATGSQVGGGTSTPKTVAATGLSSSTSSNIGTATGGEVYAPSRGQVTGSKRAVYAINSVTTSIGTFSIPGTVYQEANEELGETINDVVSIRKTSPSGNIANSGGSATFGVSATYSGTKDFTSGEYPVSGNRTATISATSGYTKLSPTSITGSGTVTLTLGSNTGAAKTYTVTAKTSEASDAATVTQNAVSVVLTPEYSTLEVGSAAISIGVTYTSTINGSLNQNVTVTSNRTWATVDTTSSSGTKLTTIIKLTENTSTTENRIATITLKDNATGKTASVTITQHKAEIVKPTKLVKFNGYFSFRPTLTGNDYTVVNINSNESGYTKATFSAIEDDDAYYTGGTFSYYFIVSSTKSASGKIVQTASSTMTVTQGSSTAISLLSITGTNSSANYVLVYVNGSLFGDPHMIERNPE